MKPNKDDQIAAILSSTELDLAAKYFAGDVRLMEASWTITKDDVKSYIATHGFPEGWVQFSPKTYDGLYLVERDSKWLLYYQERGAIDYEERFESRAEALDELLDCYYLRRRGIT